MLGEAQTRVGALVRITPREGALSHGDITDRVLTAVGGAGLHQHAPKESSALFTNLSGSTVVEWWVQWDDITGIQHVVTVCGREVATDLSGSLGWECSLAAQKERVLAILCRLVRELEQLHERATTSSRPSTATAAEAGRIARGRNPALNQ
jgi:hypothetical protein